MCDKKTDPFKVDISGHDTYISRGALCVASWHIEQLMELYVRGTLCGVTQQLNPFNDAAITYTDI